LKYGSLLRPYAVIGADTSLEIPGLAALRFADNP
jgi:hypothetical protein